MLDFRVLGPFEVVVDGTVLQVGGRQPRSVLALLALHSNGVVSTDTIVDSLWGADIPDSAVAVVRTYVWRLRRVLAITHHAHLSTRPPGYVLDTAPHHVDAHRFLELVRRAHHELDAGHTRTASARLQRALSLWRGAVVADLAGFDAMRPTIARLEETRLAAIESYMDAELALGHHAAIVGDLKALSEEHPFRERLWGQRMVALYRSGRQLDALATYEDACRTLGDEVGVEPSPELQDLARRIGDHADDLHWAGATTRSNGGTVVARDPLPPQAPFAPPADRGAYVGRVAEGALLRERLDEVLSGRFRAVLVAGAPGMGKSALVRRLATEAQNAGAVVVGGWADEDSIVPFQPLAEAVGYWARRTDPADLDRLTTADAAHLARIAPALAERSATPPRSALPVEDLDRQGLFEAIARWMELLTAREPAVLVLEDLHWADPACVLAVRHLLRHPPASPALLLATYRQTGAGGRSTALGGLLAGTVGDDHVDRIELASLTDQELVGLIGAFPGGDRAADVRAFATRLKRWTGGNPLFVHETLRHLIDHGAIDPGARSWGHGQPLETYGIPAGVDALLDERLRRLPGATTRALQQAAILGQSFELPLLSRTLEVRDIEALDALEPALAAGLLTAADAPAGVPAFGFSHALMREAILNRVPATRRARIHWRAGRALTASSAPDPAPQLGEVARHLAAGAQAGDPHVALDACVRAGQHALSVLAFEAALAHFTSAVRLLETLPDADPDLACAAWFGLGYVKGVLGDRDGQRYSFLRAVAVARAHRRPDALAFLTIGLATCRLAAGPSALGARPIAELIDEAQTALGSAPSVERCCFLAFMAVRAALQTRPGRARRLARRTEEEAASLGIPTAEAVALMARGWALVGSPDHRELQAVGQRALALSFTAAPQVGVALRRFVVPLLALPALQRGDRHELEAIRREAAADLASCGDPEIMTSWLASDAACALAGGRFDEVARLTAQLDATDWGVWREVARYQRGVAAIEQGHHARIASTVTTALTGAPPASRGGIRARALLASLHAAAGNAAEATEYLGIVRQHMRFGQPGWDTAFLLRRLAEAAAQRADGGLAADLLPVLAGYSGQMLVTSIGIAVEAAADRAIGQALMALGRLDEAVERLAAAEELERSFGAEALAVRSAYWQARARLGRGHRGDRETAGGLLRRASSEARRLGMVRLEQECTATLP